MSPFANEQKTGEKNNIPHYSDSSKIYNRTIVDTVSKNKKQKPKTGTTISGISYQLRDIYSICMYCWNVATYKWKVHQKI